ncbi:integrin beta-PS-like isoform X2 [Portunus trituberculatus]|uniref:integrin beta-PS-like isoform X2 n=1 Tax=Portunus trituberculatus TaxID=210409 RepID=UPI001E1CC86B|nr:integrin beta-PS-like isoform X2 [Portunus trituberculatus]XP_045106618.1 integrin beta-PS-like isoform X2 [Portunus trituberculatus]
MWLRLSRVAVWAAVVAVVCGVAWASSGCSNKNSCSGCIQTPNCMWCGRSGNFTGVDGKSLPRCIQLTDDIASEWRQACGDNVNEPANYFEVLINNELTQAGGLATGEGAAGSAGAAGSYGEQVVQIKPQRVSMQLRVQESLNMQVTFRQAEDYPVDLYYLMDLSNSMKDDKESLSKLGIELATEMDKITRNFKLGFGSFVDKTVMPYVSTVPQKLVEPCSECAAPYGFKNALSLNRDASIFAEKVQEAPVSGNLDAPEGGFDAIMQAIVCQEQIEWRQEARRLLLFSTDAGFHYAGDGKLGGIVKPNDGECHLNERGEYTHSVLQDYPSVSQINQVAKLHKINLIFAVTREQSAVYSRLAQMIEGSSQGELTQNSSNVVQLVKDEYAKITSKVELKDNATSPVIIKYYSKCKGITEKETSECKGLFVGDQVEFRAEITVDKCPEDPSEWNQVIGIYPVGLRESLIIDLEMICNCPCERPGDEGYEVASDECSGHGTYQCGVCDCDKGYLGSRCECGSSTPWGVGGSFDDSSCRQTNTSAICSGRGTCTCGECKCNERENPNERVDGDFCECTNFLCNRFNGKLCGGLDHGECVCNKCQCKPGWTGDNCMCEDSKDQCMNPQTGEECSGQGVCECNQCKCKEGKEGRYSGKYCEDCPICKGKCLPYKPCVQCQVFKTGELTPEECLDNCTQFNSTIVDVVVEEEGERLCTFFDENDCRFKFVYGYDEFKEPVVRVQEVLECPPELDLLGIILGVIGAIVAVGLALLFMWKVLTTIHDRREYARFEKERMMAKWDTGENPIFKQATSTFKNPMYGGGK